MDDNELESIAERLLKPGFELGPFAYRVMLEKKLAAQLDFKKFKEDMSLQFLYLPTRMTELTLRYLYDICLDALVDKMLVDKARKIIRPAGWSKSRKSLRALIKSLRSYQPRDIEKRLRTQLSVQAPSRSQSAAKELLVQIAQLDQICNWWEGFAAWDSWGAFYRGHVWALDKYLSRKGYRVKDHRTEIIAGVVKAMGVERRASKEAIARSLLREAKTPRRFVFPLERSDFADLS